MVRLPSKFVLAVGSAFLISVSLGVSAATVTESGDAGESLATAQVLPGGTTLISGSISVVNNADMFKFGWGGGTFDVNTSTSAIDTQLFLFDSLGMGVRADDDSGLVATSVLSLALAAGTYYLAVSEYAYDPLSIGGFIFPLGPANGGPTGLGGGSALSGWDQRGAAATGGYVINFRTATSVIPDPNDRPLPEPTSLLLLGAGLAAMSVRHRRRSVRV